MVNPALSVSRLVNVSVDLTPAPAQFPNLTTCLVLGTGTEIDLTTRMREYDSLSAVGLDFSTNTEEYLSAALWFEQAPQPTTLNIGRWAKVAAAGQLIGGPLSAANSVIGPWNAVVNGSFSITVDGGGVIHVDALDFSGAANLNAVAADITTGLGIHGSCAYHSSTNNFVFTSPTTGAASTMSFLSAPDAGVDISDMLAGRAADSAFLAPGVAAQTALATVQLFDTLFAGQWYGLAIPSGTAADYLAVAPYIEGDSTPHFYEATSQDPNCLLASSTADIMYEAQQLKYTKSAIQYSSQNLYAGTSLLARILTTNWSGNNTTITLMYKQEPGIVPENLNSTQANAIDAKNGNVFVSYNNNTAIIESGITPSGQYIDTVIGCDWLRGAVQTAVFNVLYGANKVPQTDGGMHLIATAIETVLQQGVTNGLIAPGVWNAGGFGQLEQGDFLPKGYYVYTPPISSQSQSDRAARKSVPFQVAVKLAGAVQTVNVLINVNP